MSTSKNVYEVCYYTLEQHDDYKFLSQYKDDKQALVLEDNISLALKKIKEILNIKDTNITSIRLSPATII